jgi:uncharacterized protein (TIGR03083 family)
VDVWPMIREERIALADALAGLPADAWDQPSLAAGWTVREVVGHLIATARMTPPKFFASLIRSGFSFQKFTGKEIHANTAGRTDADLVAAYRSCVDARTSPPGPAPSWLGETIVHGEDIFRALGNYRHHPTDHVLAVADFYKTSNLLIGAKNRIAGVTLRATDADWTYGTGPEAAGTAIAVVLAMTGRKAALDDLTGDGVAVLRSRG